MLFSWRYVAAKYVPLWWDTLFVIFNDHVDGEVDPCTRTDRFSKWFTKNWYSCIYVWNSRNDWYQDDEMLQLLPLIKWVATGYRQVISYWASMWWFAALAFSWHISADTVLCFAPQVKLENRPWYYTRKERVWFESMFSVEEWISKKADIFVYYWTDEVDVKSIEEDLVPMCNNMEINIYPRKVNYDTHYIMAELQKHGSLWDINHSVVIHKIPNT